MSGNSLGTLFRFSSFGESHGPSIGGIIEGCPPNIQIDTAIIQRNLRRRSPRGFFATARKEEDQVLFLSGIFEGSTLGTPIAFQVENRNTRSEDYEKWKDSYRPSHADYVYQKKYGIRDYRGGGRASGRETLARVVAGSIALQVLAIQGIKIEAYVSQIGRVALDLQTPVDYLFSSQHETACPNARMAEEVLVYLSQIKKEKESVGGKIVCRIKNCPVGLGEPVFDRLSADLAKAMFSIPTARALEWGAGSQSASMKGSEYMDLFLPNFRTSSNHSGGVQGGISNGEEISFSIAFRPISSISKEIPLLSASGEQRIMPLGGRHDVCHIPRLTPIVESMAAIILLDHYLRARAYQVDRLP